MLSILSIVFAFAAALLEICSATGSIHQFRSSGVSNGQPRQALWQPGRGLKWQYVLNGSIGDVDPSVDVYDVDLYDTSDADWNALKSAGKSIICYFSAGSFEKWRADANKFHPSDYGVGLPGWAGEFWLDTNSANVRRIMSQRIVDAANRGCDGIDPDNIDAYNNPESSKLGLSADTSKDYLTFLHHEAKQMNLAIGLKNGIDLAETVSQWLDWQVNESCLSPPNPTPVDPNKRGSDESKRYTTSSIRINQSFTSSTMKECRIMCLPILLQGFVATPQPLDFQASSKDRNLQRKSSFVRDESVGHIRHLQ